MPKFPDIMRVFGIFLFSRFERKPLQKQAIFVCKIAILQTFFESPSKKWQTIKSVQGDSGHAQMKMVVDVYTHILDEDRRINAQRFEEEFYSGKEESNKTDVEEPAPAKSDL